MYDVFVWLYGKKFELFEMKGDLIVHYTDWYDTPFGDSIPFENENVVNIDYLKNAYLRK